MMSNLLLIPSTLFKKSNYEIFGIIKDRMDKTVEFEVLLKNKISISIVYEPIIISNDSVYISPDFYGIFSGNPTAKKSNKHEGLEKLLSEMLQPYYIKNNASPNFRKIKNALRTLHNQTIQIPLKDLI